MFDGEEQPEAGIVLRASNLEHTMDFLVGTFGFRVEKIFPADSPSSCTLIGHGTRLHLEVGDPQPTLLRVEISDPEHLLLGPIHGPDHLTVEFVDASPQMRIPPLVSSFSLTHADDEWHTGRAGMHYRDLVPDRQGGAVIASHIRVPGTGPVPDYVHFHEIAFQLIFCRRGTATVVYEDQGEPFTLVAGDCVTQPPRIRHRVLESSDDLEVVEIGYPADHITRADPTISLPTSVVDRRRTWDRQVLVHHRRSGAIAMPLAKGISVIETEVSVGTEGLADVSQVDIESATWNCPLSIDREFVLAFVLEGRGTAHLDGPSDTPDCALESGSALVVPVGFKAAFSAPERMSLLHVRIRTR